MRAATAGCLFSLARVRRARLQATVMPEAHTLLKGQNQPDTLTFRNYKPLLGVIDASY